MTLFGVDVSHWNGTVNWAHIKQDGKTFAFAKATHGPTIHDARFAANWQAMKDNGIIRGAYHYLLAVEDAAQQAELFLQTVHLEAGDLPPALDVERTYNGAATNAQFVQSVGTWLQIVQQRTGRTPLLYTSQSVWDSHLHGQFLNYPLWIANFYVQEPALPAGFNGYSFWQYTDKGEVQGVSPFDLDQFAGTLDQLHTFISTH